ncbi:MAG: HDOD domain-containing protein [Planctomycetes bacterium]|jgi:putative nucleotidyltransferase with HDIG domain|nr:HDOD domain-containing protein [Planctomycetota bacterium]
MSQKHVDATASRKVELAISELGSLSVPPGVAVQYLSKLLPGEFSPATVADIVECEPALAAGILALAQRLAAGPASQRHVVRLVLDRLDADAVRSALLQTKVAAGFEIEFAREQPALPSRNDLILHSLAVACAARRIATAAESALEPNLAYAAGLLHDIGKLALQDTMPKSLATITKEAEATGTSLYQIEQKHLGTNHALLGKQLAQRWRLPEPVKLAIWLHHRHAQALAESVPEARLAVVVQAADSLARQANIGLSGSFDEPQPLESIAASVGVDADVLAQIRAELPAEVRRKSACLGLEIPQATARYCDLIQATAAQLSRRHAQLAAQDRSLQTASSLLDFTQEFLRGVRADMAALDIAEDFAQRWQRFFQTGAVCLYLTAGSREGVVDAAIVEALGHSHRTVLRAPQNGSLLPKPLAGRFALLEARDQIDWLLEQLDFDFNGDQTRLLPLLSDGQAVGVLAFELNYPDDISLFAEKFERAAALAGTILGLALTRERQEDWAERFAQADGEIQRTQDRGQQTGDGQPRAQAGAPPSSGLRHPSAETCPPVEALAEMAAGVAHELNNPLSVIAGRAQLLAQAESDGQKRHVLDVIGENAREAANVVEDLMSYAEPSPPRAARTPISEIVNESIQLAAHKTGAPHVNAQVHISAEVQDVLVDSAQVVVALANIIANAIESYVDPTGPIKITAEPGPGWLRLQVNDLGCGMDEATVRKATSPFFSAKPAGRKRGMGLAYASRMIRLNRGALEIDSQPEHGTTVTVTLPCK